MGVREALERSPVVFVNGPRQAGKSTLARHLVASGVLADYLTFDDMTVFAAASSDPEGFLRGIDKPVVLDEVQQVPDLYRALKARIDERRGSGRSGANGRFLLTGSANALTLPGLADALVGRMSVLTLFPFSASEVLGRGVPVVNGLFDQEIRTGTEEGPSVLEEAVARATFPEISGVRGADANAWLNGYVATLLQRDVRQLAEIERIAALPGMLGVLAGRAAGLLNDADSARDAKLNAMTYRRYRALMQQLFLIALVPPWSRNVSKRFVKSPKLYFTDTTLLCHLLGVDFPDLRRRNPSLFGRVTENFVATELMKQIALLPDGTLHHFRTQNNREVDFVIERRSGALIGIEVKAASSVTAGDFSGLKELKEAAGKDFRRGIVLYLGHSTTAFGNDMIAVPVETLWMLNMNVTTDREVRKSNDAFDAYDFSATYGDRTRLRCRIDQTTIDDHFCSNANEERSLAAVKKHWDVIWPVFQRKIVDGQSELIERDNGPQPVAGRVQTIRQVTLTPQDIGYRDFRQSG